MRRKPKENNFKAVLETIRDLMNTECVVPDWLHDILLGYGDPSAAHYTNMPNQAETLDFKDTFINLDHIKSSFPDHQVVANDNSAKLIRPFRLTFEEDEGSRKKITVEPYTIEKRGPYLFNEPKKYIIYKFKK